MNTSASASMQTWTGTPEQWQQQLLHADRPRYVVTATSRLAQRLRDELQASLQCTARVLIPAPQIMDYASWLQQLWSVLSFQHPQPLRLLTDIQVQQVWRRVLQASELDVLDPGSVIDLAIKTYQTLRAYRLQDADWQSFSSGDARWFAQAYQHYHALLRQQHFLDPADLPTALMQADVGSYVQQVDIDWVGFVQHTPEQLFWMQYLTGCQQRLIQWQVASTQTLRVQAMDATDEFQQALTWAVGMTQTSPDARVAIVVPELQNTRAALIREAWRFEHHHHHHQSTPTQSTQSTQSIPAQSIPTLPSISFSGGQPLAQLPLFKTLLSALSLLLEPWQLADVLRLCRSTFIHQTPTSIRQKTAGGDAHLLPESLHTQLPQRASPQVFQQFLTAAGLTPTWLPIVRQHIGQVAQTRRLSSWCEFAQNLLAQLQWPGELTLNSNDYQAAQKITQLWDSLRSADPLADAWSWSEFLLLLQQQAQQQLFQPQSPVCRIQVLGLWETMGQCFDGLWVMGLHQDAWPRPTRLSAFLPRDVQLLHQLPRACPQQECALAQQLLTQWQHCAHQLVLSFAEHAGAAHQLASPLILAVAPRQNTPPICAQLPHWVLEDDQESQPLPIKPDEKIRGGVAILATQALCAFQAFARFRLRVKADETTVLGLSAQTRGILVHSCLEMFWRQHQHQDALKALTPAQLQQQLQTIIDSALKTLPLKQSTALNQALISAERQRLLNLLSQWLQMETLRTPFKVMALEQAITVQLSALQLSVRLDRMDQLASGETVLIDYKTGAVNLQDWWHQPCLAPQLPLYALTVSPRADAIVYGVVLLPKPMLKGLSAAGLQMYAEVPRHLAQAVDALDNWTDLQGRWQQDIHQLASDFSEGVTQLSPINGDATCARCGLQALCRVTSY